MDPKVHADRFQYPGGPAEQPYDLTGYSLPLQMGVRVDRVTEPFAVVGPAVAEISPADGGRAGSGTYGYLLSPNTNASALAINRLLKAGAQVARLTQASDIGSRSWVAGTFVIRNAGAQLVETLGRDLGLEFAAALLGLPVRNVVAGVSTRDFYVPGSLIRVEVEPSDPLTFGMDREAVATTWRHALVMEVIEAAREKSSQAGEQILTQQAVVFARFPTENVRADGWVIGETRYLAGRPAAVRVPLGKGQVVLLGFRPDTRGQSRNTFKLLFNPLFASTARKGS